MKIVNREEFMKKSVETIKEMLEMLEGLKGIKLADLDGKETALFIVDMINGFAREGALKSSRVEELIPEIVKLSKKCDEFGIQKIAFADCHTEASPEFGSYPRHSMVGTT